MYQRLLRCVPCTSRSTAPTSFPPGKNLQSRYVISNRKLPGKQWSNSAREVTLCKIESRIMLWYSPLNGLIVYNVKNFSHHVSCFLPATRNSSSASLDPENSQFKIFQAKICHHNLYFLIFFSFFFFTLFSLSLT